MDLLGACLFGSIDVVTPSCGWPKATNVIGTTLANINPVNMLQLWLQLGQRQVGKQPAMAKAKVCLGPWRVVDQPLAL